jgi:hypothetical protein
LEGRNLKEKQERRASFHVAKTARLSGGNYQKIRGCSVSSVGWKSIHVKTMVPDLLKIHHDGIIHLFEEGTVLIAVNEEKKKA